MLHHDQTCNVLGRSITDNLLLIRDSFEYIYQKQYPIAMISLDQEKAFDRLDWSFLDKVMEKMNFGNSFRSWVKLLYRDANCRILLVLKVLIVRASILYGGYFFNIVMPPSQTIYPIDSYSLVIVPAQCQFVDFQSFNLISQRSKH